MPLHRLTQIVMGVPNVEQTAAYYTEFGLTPTGDLAGAAVTGSLPNGAAAATSVTDGTDAQYTFATTDGGEQLKIVHSPLRRLVRIGVGADDQDDVDRVVRQLEALDLAHERTEDGVRASDPGTRIEVTVQVADRVAQEPTPAPSYNTPGVIARSTERASGVLRESAVKPRKLGHVVVGSTDQELSQRFFQEGIGFKVSDTVPGLAAFMRCSTDHHNVLVQQAPLTFLHHTSWQVDDVDDVGRGATAMLEKDPERHVWGLGRHHVGSNFFWYLKDPAGNFSEYYSDLDCIVDDALWEPGVWEGAKGLYNWGPPPPPSFLAPEDLAELMTGAHQPG